MQSQFSHMTELIRLQPFTVDSLQKACTGPLLNLDRLRDDGRVESCDVLPQAVLCFPLTATSNPKLAKSATTPAAYVSSVVHFYAALG